MFFAGTSMCLSIIANYPNVAMDCEKIPSSLYADRFKCQARDYMVKTYTFMVFSTNNGRKIKSEIHRSRNYFMENYFTNFNSHMKYTRNFLRFTTLKMHMTLSIINYKAEINFSKLSIIKK